MLGKTKIVTYSHGIAVYPGNRRCREALVDYCYTLIQWEWTKKPPSWRPIRTMKKVYAGATRDRSEFRFHRNLLEEVIQHLDGYGVRRSNIEFVELPPVDPVQVEFPVTADMVPRDYQEGIIDFLAGAEPTIKVTNLQTGKGKAQPLDSMIKVPGGWKRMGDMSVGDDVVAWDGSTSKVTGVYPQGKKQIYRITFGDGRTTEACGEHLWKVYYVNTVPHKRWRIVTTEEMLRLISMPNPRVYVPLCESEMNDDVELPIPPYTLGTILGDGGLSGTSITLNKLDEEVFDNVRSEFPDDLEFSTRNDMTKAIVTKSRHGANRYRVALTEMGLAGSTSWVKFIPKEYLQASSRQRLELLQGLMDTDGTVNVPSSGGAISYSTTSVHLASDVQYLVRSLGGIASISERHPSFTYKGEKKKGRKAYQINIRFKTPSKLFRLPRKRERTNDDGQYAKGLKLRVSSIEPISVKEAQCISIDHPDRLYVTDDFVVTHNTFCALSAMIKVGVRTVIQLRGGYIARWIDDLEGLFDFKKGEVLVIRGRDSLLSLINMAKNDELKAKVIIISNKTLYKFFEEHEKNTHDNYYECKPEELYALLRAGLRIVDEVHEDYHLSFRTDIYSHVPSSIHLSATLHTEDVFRRRMYDIALPKDCWYKGVEYDKYIVSYALFYQNNGDRKIRTSERGQDTYSHGAYEKSIMKHKEMLNNYLEIIRWPVQKYYIDDDWQGGQKCIVFCYMVEFCELVRDHLLRHYPELDVQEYVAETSEAVLKTADIIVSTIKSAGTAQDIPDLKTAILTHAVRKKESNIQTLGRLRKLKRWPDVTPNFIYLNNTSIEAHMKYHDAKIEIFKPLVLAQRVDHIPIKL